MLIQYIEDSDTDAHSFLRLARENNLFDVEVSDSIDSIPSCGSDRSDIALLVDVVRPDAVSIEDDVQRLREQTAAPIAFVTGESTHDMRDRAVRAGAIDVLDKARLTADLIIDLFGTRIAAFNALVVDYDMEHPRSDVLPNFQLRQLEAPLQYLENGLGALLEGLNDNDKSVAAPCVGGMLHAVHSMQTFAQSDLRLASPVGVHQVFQDIKEHCARIADAKDIKLSFDAEWAWIGQIGDPGLAKRGLQHFLEALLMMAEPRALLKVCTTKRRNGAFVTALLSKPTAIKRDAFFSVDDAMKPQDLAALSSLRLASLLLNLCPEQVSIRMVGSIQEVRLAL